MLGIFLVVFLLSNVEEASAFSYDRLETSRTFSSRRHVKDENMETDWLSMRPGEATQRLGGNTGPTVWSEFGGLAQKYDPVNLGQGFPDWLPPKFAVDSLVEAVQDSAKSPHQYTRSAGHPSLVEQLARRYSIHLKRDIEPMSEVAVTVGASQALYISLQTLVEPGKIAVLSPQIRFMSDGSNERPFHRR